ncbi:hypothetical protein BGZ76_007498 [Entomortierella beljakovae]|nr:hypothetical protein BGZ76_007498 [Entomortierella beljakovae]
MELHIPDDNTYAVDDENQAVAQLWSKKWLKNHSLTDNYVRDLFGVKKGRATNLYELGYFEQKKPSISYIWNFVIDDDDDDTEEITCAYDHDCIFCDSVVCSCSPINANLQPSGMWDQDSKFLKAEHVLIRTESLIGGESLEFDTCIFIQRQTRFVIPGPNFRYGSGSCYAPIFIAMSYVASEGWFENGISEKIRHRIYAAAKFVDATHVWIDSICLPPGNRIKQLETMGMLYSFATAVCVLSHEVILSGDANALWSSIWMTRMWTMQEGYNARKLLVLTKLERDEFASVSYCNVPKDYRKLVANGDDVSASTAIAMMHGRTMGNYNDMVYVIASLMEHGHRLIINVRMYGRLMVVLAIALVLDPIVVAIVLATKHQPFDGDLATLGMLYIFAFTLGLAIIHICILLSFGRVVKWTNTYEILKSCSRLDSSILLMSPQPNLPQSRCWFPGSLRQHTMEVVAVMSLADTIEKWGYEASSNKLGKYGLNIKGKLLDRSQTLDFIQHLDYMEDWLWIDDAKVVATNVLEDKDMLVFMCVNEGRYSFPWMSFGFVKQESDNIIYRTERFWILPVTCLTSHYCLSQSTSFWMGSKFAS